MPKKQTLFKPVQEEIEMELIEKLKDEKDEWLFEPELSEKEIERNNLMELYSRQQSFSGYEIKFHNKIEILELERKLLLPRIKIIIDKLRGRYNAEHHELSELLNCYNLFYKRSDSFTCSACVARAYDALKKLV